MSTASLAFALTLAISTIVSGDMQARQPDPRRPLILIVHGRGLPTRDSVVFRREALAALRAGAFRATGDSLLDQGDVGVVWYADLMDVRRRESRTLTSCDDGGSTADEGSSAGFFLRSLAQVVSELVDVSGTDSSEYTARDLAGDLRFIGDRTVRCGAQARVANALVRARADGRPVIVVAHSLGALVTWGYLEHRGGRDVPEIERLVTVGSPIGNDGLRELVMGDTTRVSLPSGVKSWVNAVNIDDAFAARITTSDAALPGVTDITTERTDDTPHDLHGYLRDPRTVKAVVSAWCAGAQGRNRIAGCIALSKE